jgi:hypothetical protein
MPAGFGAWEMLTHSLKYLTVSEPIVLPCTAVVYAMLAEIQSNSIESLKLQQVSFYLF